MSCFNPNKVLRTSDGRTSFLGNLNKAHQSGFHVLPGNTVEGKFINVPCGKCEGCRLDQSRAWAERCVMESLCYPPQRSWFVTLSYSNESLAFQRECEMNDLGFRNLNKRHPQLFLKSLREKWSRLYGDDNIRAFYCGEYGDASFRCHYHFLLFNISFPDLKLWSRNFEGDPLYNSDALSSVWPHGYAVIGEMSYKTAAYTARYVLKKRKQGGEVDYDAAHVVPEFTRMSNRPGIGIPFYQLHAEEILRDGKIYLPSADGNPVVAGLPRLFRDRAEKDFPELYADFVAKKENMCDVLNREFLRQLPSFDEREYFSAKALDYKYRLSALKRTLL